jgi:hypothetical protein
VAQVGHGLDGAIRVVSIAEPASNTARVVVSGWSGELDVPRPAAETHVVACAYDEGVWSCDDPRVTP